MISVIKNGWHRTSGIRRYVVLLYVLNLLVGVSLASIVGREIARSLGHSLAANQMIDSFAPLWFQEFSRHAEGLVRTFHPAVSGMGAILSPLDALITGRPFQAFPGLVWLGVAYILLWVLFSAGAFGKMASDTERSFWNAVGTFWGRFVVLGGVFGIVYYLILGQLLPVLSASIRQMTRDVTDERIVFYYTLGKWLVVWLLALLTHLAFDFSRIAAVAHNIRFVPRAMLQGLGMVFKHPLRTLGLMGVFLLVAFLGMLVYAVLAPGARGGTMGAIFLTFFIGQLYLLFRMVVRLWLWGSEVALWQDVHQG